MLPLKAHFESMFAVNLRDIIGELKSRTDFIRRQERVATQGLQTADSEGGKSTILRQLRDAHNATLGKREVGQIVGRGRDSRGVQVIEAGT